MVSLKQKVNVQESSYRYWPEEVGKVMVCGRLRVKLGQVMSHEDTVERMIEVTTVEEIAHQRAARNTLNITMIQLISWPQQGLPHPSSIISVIDHLTVAQMRSSSKQTVVMCRLDSNSYYISVYNPFNTIYSLNSDGVTRTGTFICIHSQLERLKTEGVVDVFQAIKSARTQRSGLIPNMVGLVDNSSFISMILW